MNIGPAPKLFERWLAAPPAAALLAVWKDYIGALSVWLNPEDRRALKTELLGRARAVAEAAGGFLGIVGRVSPPEANVLNELLPPTEKHASGSPAAANPSR